MSSNSPRPPVTGAPATSVLASRRYGVIASVLMIATMIYIGWTLMNGPDAAAPVAPVVEEPTADIVTAMGVTPTPRPASLYADALATRDKMERALAEEFGGDLQAYADIVQNPPPPTPVGGSGPVVESTHDTVFVAIAGPVLEGLLQKWGNTVAVNALDNGWREIYLATPDNPARREQLARDIAEAMQQSVSLPPGTDRILFVEPSR